MAASCRRSGGGVQPGGPRLWENHCHSRVSSPFRALRSRNYRLFFIGQGISLIGSWMTRLATSWLVYRLTDSEFLLGVVAFASQAPIQRAEARAWTA